MNNISITISDDTLKKIQDLCKRYFINRNQAITMSIDYLFQNQDINLTIQKKKKNCDFLPFAAKACEIISGTKGTRYTGAPIFSGDITNWSCAGDYTEGIFLVKSKDYGKDSKMVTLPSRQIDKLQELSKKEGKKPFILLLLLGLNGKPYFFLYDVEQMEIIKEHDREKLAYFYPVYNEDGSCRGLNALLRYRPDDIPRIIYYTKTLMGEGVYKGITDIYAKMVKDSLEN